MNGAFNFLNDLLIPRNVVSCRSHNGDGDDSHENRLLFGKDPSLYDRSCLLPLFLSSPLYVGAEDVTSPEGEGGYHTINRPYCGTKTVRCQTITYGDTTINPYKDVEIQVGVGRYEESEVKMYANRKKVIIGTSAENTIITSVYVDGGLSVLFDIPSTTPNATLDISRVSFIHTTVTSPLFSVVGSNATLDLDTVMISSGSETEIQTQRQTGCLERELISFWSAGTSLLHLKKVTIKNTSLKVSAIVLGEGSAQICECKFYDVSCTSAGDGNGGVFNIVVKPMKVVEFVEGCEFKNCSIVSTGSVNGGAIYSYLKEGGVLRISGTTSFTDCRAQSTNEGGKGRGYGKNHFCLLL
jgi:hypothetical protein